MKERRIPYKTRKAMEPSPHLPEAIEEARLAVAENRDRRRRATRQG